jgi:prophage DNA circulation protein
MSDWTDSLQQASLAGVPFAVLGAGGRHGRQVAQHIYPGKDKSWNEDLGRAPRGFPVAGFLISDSALYGGGDVIGQVKKMIAVFDTAGPYTLVHPILGELQVSVPKDAFAWDMRWDQGRYIEITFTCLEGGEKEFPTSSTATTDATDDAADAADEAASDDYFDAVTGTDLLSSIEDALAKGASVLNMVVSTVEGWAGLVLSYAQDATSLFNMLVNLPGNFGRYAGGRTVGFASSALQAATGATVASLISEGVAARAAVSAAVAALVDVAATADPKATAQAAQGAAAALLAATANPADAVRILSALVAYFPAQPTGPSVTGQAEAIVQRATGAMVRRAAYAALARATALYQPSSADDAATLRNSMADLFQAEIVVAGDAGDDATYSALRALRAAIIADLDTRGGKLPGLQVVNLNASLPAPVLAQKLYQDASRADELVIEADPVHPAFMPMTFSALEK